MESFGISSSEEDLEDFWGDCRHAASRAVSSDRSGSENDTRTQIFAIETGISINILRTLERFHNCGNSRSVQIETLVLLTERSNNDTAVMANTKGGRTLSNLINISNSCIFSMLVYCIFSSFGIVSG